MKLAEKKISRMINTICEKYNLLIDETVLKYFANYEDTDKMCRKIYRKMQDLLINYVKLNNASEDKKARIVYDDFNKIQIVDDK